ncbi:hypothetical protein BG030_05070 [Pseudomonas putida]|nr:hypothetical protein BG030_05070 [Pseudomonas putida]
MRGGTLCIYSGKPKSITKAQGLGDRPGAALQPFRDTRLLPQMNAFLLWQRPCVAKVTPNA